MDIKSNRRLYDGRSIPDEHLGLLLPTSELDGIDVVAVRTSDPAIKPIIGLINGEQPLLLIRLGYARPVPHAPRRRVEEVLQTPA